MFNAKRLFQITFFLFLSILIVSCCRDSKKASTSLQSNQAKSNHFWWPELINLQALRQHAKESSPMAKSFNYAREFKKLNLKRVKKDIEKVLKDSQEWWPADFGHYGPLFIRMAWHSAGTYRVHDGRGGAGGGQQRFEPLNSWPDNANLDKARRLLWPVKKKYGKKLSWADLMVLTGNVSLESMGFKTLGFAGGRIDDWEPDLVYWGPETKMLDDKRHTGKRKLKKPLGAVQMGLIYVNPEGPNGNPDPLLAAQEIRRSFGRMAMDDEEVVALIAGGHSFGKAHGAKKGENCVGPEPSAEGLEKQGFGWKNSCGTGKGKDAITSGFEGAWTSTPTRWSMQFLSNLFAFEWVQSKSPRGAIQWVPKEGQGKGLVPDAFDPAKKHVPIMFTTDLALKFDPEYKKISQRFLKDQKEFERAFAKAWFKLTHRDMGPRARYLGANVPPSVFKWQDPIPKLNHQRINNKEIAKLKEQILKSGLTVSELVKVAWSSASSFRGTDKRGGANGARVRLSPQKQWSVNDPEQLSKTLSKLSKIKEKFNKSLSEGKKVSLADVIVLAGAVGVEKAAKKAGVTIPVPFKVGRMDASQKQTDVKSYSFLEPKADGFRNYYSKEAYGDPVYMLVDKANMLNLTVPEMTVLIGGLRVLGANTKGSSHGVFTKRVGTLSNDFFLNLLDMSVKWSKSKTEEGVYEGFNRKDNKLKWTGTSVDLVFGSSSELRAIAEVYAANDAKRKFVQDFVKAWTKVMQLDRFDLKYR